MKKTLIMTMSTVAISILCFGCLGRLFSEGKGATTGASGKVGDSGSTRNLAQYKSLRVEPITVSSGVPAPSGMPAMVQMDLETAAAKRGLAREGEPGLNLSGEIIHYETSSKRDAALSPLEEVVVHAILTDAQSGDVVGETNLTGRSKATSSSGKENLSEGVGKALDEWLDDGGLKRIDDDDDDR